MSWFLLVFFFFFFQAEDGIRDYKVTGVQTCALPIWILQSGPGIRRFSMERTGSGVPPAVFRLSIATLRASSGEKDSNGGFPSASAASSSWRTAGSSLGLNMCALRALVGVDDIVFEIDGLGGGRVIAGVGMPVLGVASGCVYIPAFGAWICPSGASQGFLLFAIETILHFA